MLNPGPLFSDRDLKSNPDVVAEPKRDPLLESASWLGPFPNSPPDLLELLLAPKTELPNAGLESLFSDNLVKMEVDDEEETSPDLLALVGAPNMVAEPPSDFVGPEPPNIAGLATLAPPNRGVLAWGEVKIFPDGLKEVELVESPKMDELLPAPPNTVLVAPSKASAGVLVSLGLTENGWQALPASFSSSSSLTSGSSSSLSGSSLSSVSPTISLLPTSSSLAKIFSSPDEPNWLQSMLSLTRSALSLTALTISRPPFSLISLESRISSRRAGWLPTKALQISLAPADFKRQSPRFNTSNLLSFFKAVAIALAPFAVKVLSFMLRILRFGLEAKASARAVRPTW